MEKEAAISLSVNIQFWWRSERPDQHCSRARNNNWPSTTVTVLLQTYCYDCNSKYCYSLGKFYSFGLRRRATAGKTNKQKAAEWTLCVCSDCLKLEPFPMLQPSTPPPRPNIYSHSQRRLNFRQMGQSFTNTTCVCGDWRIWLLYGRFFMKRHYYDWPFILAHKFINCLSSNKHGWTDDESYFVSRALVEIYLMQSLWCTRFVLHLIELYSHLK